MKEWKIYIVGSIEDTFQIKIDNFYLKNPDKRESIIFTGLISQKEKFLLYNRARVFLFTSRHESYAFALAEAAYMHNYIISTNVGIAEELKEISPCFLSNENDKELLIQELQMVILMSDEELNHLMPDSNLQEITWEAVLKENEGMKKLAGIQ